MHEDAIDLVQFFEGCSNIAYACESHISNGGKWPYLTIGYGHSGPDVIEGMKITTTQARDLLARDLANVEHMVSGLVKVPLTAVQLGAVCALAMNLKPGLFKSSHTLAKLNARDFGSFNFADAMKDPIGPGLTGMAREWAEFRGVEQQEGPNRHLRGLIKRRAAELELFFNGHWSVPKEDRMPQLVVDVKPKAKPDEMFRPGMRADIVNDLHEALGAAGYPVTCGDAYTWVTVEAVKAFQIAHGLKADGIYGPATAAKLNDVVNGGAH